MIFLLSSLVSAADNESSFSDMDSYDANGVSGASVESDDDVSSDNVKYFSVNNNSQINGIINDEIIVAERIVLSLDNNYTEDTFLNFDLGYDNSQKFKDVVINANNKGMDMGFDFWYEDFLHYDNIDELYGSIDVGKGYSLTFNDIRLKNMCISNYGTLIFDNSSLISYSEGITPISNYNNLLINNSRIMSVQDFIENEGGRLTVNSCLITDGIDVFYNGNIKLTNSIIRNTQFSSLGGYVANNLFTDNSTVTARGRITLENNTFSDNVVYNLFESEGNALLNNNMFVNNSADNLIFLSSYPNWDYSGKYSSFNKAMNTSLLTLNTFKDNSLKNSLIIADYPLNISDNIIEGNDLVFDKSLIQIVDNGPGYVEDDDTLEYKLDYYPHNIINIAGNNFTANNADIISNNNTNYTVNVVQNNFRDNNVQNVFAGLNVISKDNFFDSNNNTLKNSFISVKSFNAIAGDVIPVVIEVVDENNNPCNGGYVNVYFDNNPVEESYITEDGITMSIVGFDPSDYMVHEGSVLLYFVASNELNNYDNIIVNYTGVGNIKSSTYKTDNNIHVILRNATLSLNIKKIMDDNEKLVFTVKVEDLYNQTEHTQTDDTDIKFIFDNNLLKDNLQYAYVLDNNIASYTLDITDDMDRFDDNGQLREYSIKVEYTNDEYYNPASLNSTFNLGYDNRKINTISTSTYKNKISATDKINKYSITKTDNYKLNEFRPNQIITLSVLNNLFNHDFSNKHLLIYIGDVLVFNGTANDDLSDILFRISDKLSGLCSIKVVVADDNKTYTEWIYVN